MTNTIAKKTDGATPRGFGKVIDNIFQDNLQRFFDGDFWSTGTQGHAPVNIREREQAYEIDVIAPGCRKEDFSVRLDQNQLTVSFTHNEENKQQDTKEGWVRNEYEHRSFSRSFTLDDTVNAEGITATYKDGILQLNVPKNEKAKMKSRNIEVG